MLTHFLVFLYLYRISISYIYIVYLIFHYLYKYYKIAIVVYNIYTCINSSNMDTQPTLHSTCNSECRCSTSTYEPVCADGIQYFSPCHAGCSLQPVETGDGIKVCVIYLYIIRLFKFCSHLCVG